MKKKLTLNKITLRNLDDPPLETVEGGATVGTVNSCTTSLPPPPPTSYKGCHPHSVHLSVPTG